MARTSSSSARQQAMGPTGKWCVLAEEGQGHIHKIPESGGSWRGKMMGSRAQRQHLAHQYQHSPSAICFSATFELLGQTLMMFINEVLVLELETAGERQLLTIRRKRVASFLAAVEKQILKPSVHAVLTRSSLRCLHWRGLVCPGTANCNLYHASSSS